MVPQTSTILPFWPKIGIFGRIPHFWVYAEKFVKKWFKKNHADYLVNCFALNDHVDKKKRGSTLYNISLESFSDYLQVNLTALFSVCREFSRNN